jgi:HlyD family secretion protein
METKKQGFWNKIRSVKIKEFFKDRRNVWIFGSVTVVVVIAVIIIAASLNRQSGTSSDYQTTVVQNGTLTSTVEGSGTVASTHTTTLAWQTSGQVDEVNVQIGDIVHSDNVLARLVQSSLSSNIINAQVELISAQRNLESALNADSARAQAQLDLIAAQNTYDSANSAYQTLLIQNRGATDAEIQQVQSKLTIAQSNWENARDAYARVSSNPDSDPTKAQAYLSLYNATQALHAAENSLDYFSSKPSTVAINKAKATLELAQVALADAQAAFDRVQDGPDPYNVAAAQAKVDAAQSIVNQAQITSPFDGTITQMSVSPGNIVSAGTKAFRVDDLAHMVMSVEVTEIDINNVKPDQSATIVFDAIPNKIYHGKVVQVDMAGTTSQSSTTFSALVELTDSDELVKPGMAGIVTILTNYIENALLVPSTAVFTDDNTGQQFVYRVKNGGLEQVIVTVGASSDTSTQITSNELQQGDVILLSFTSSSDSGNFGMGGFGMMGGGADVVVSDTGNPPAEPLP